MPRRKFDGAIVGKKPRFVEVQRIEFSKIIDDYRRSINETISTEGLEKMVNYDFLREQIRSASPRERLNDSLAALDSTQQLNRTRNLATLQSKNTMKKKV